MTETNGKRMWKDVTVPKLRESLCSPVQRSIVSLQSLSDMLAIPVSSHRSHIQTAQPALQLDLLICSGRSQSALHHVIAELMIYQLQKSIPMVFVTSVHEGTNNGALRLLTSVRKSSFHHIGRKLVLRKLNNVLFYGGQDCPLRLVSTMLQHVLDHIIGILVCNQIVVVVQHIFQNTLQLFLVRMLEQTLQDAAPISMLRVLRCPLHQLAHNKSGLTRWHLLDAPLDHMVPMHIPHQRHHVPLKRLRQGHLLLYIRDSDSLLHHPAPVAILRQGEGVSSDFFDHLTGALATRLDKFDNYLLPFLAAADFWDRPTQTPADLLEQVWSGDGKVFSTKRMHYKLVCKLD
mmetsp:Transcript_18284/g.40461  ORF Transcript_18284/g.40461 Transcript_18284/m.40461 type:complete len:346 (+) Transcript_18284:147-1184(+)